MKLHFKRTQNSGIRQHESFPIMNLASSLFLLLIPECLAPIPPCSPFSFINLLIPENTRLRWLFHDYPGHPVPRCRWENPPLEYRSLLYFFLSEPNRITDELKT